MLFRSDSTQREALHIPEPLWRFSLVEAMIRDMSMGDAKFKPGMFVETVQDDANELVINVSLENDHIADIELAASPVQTVEFTTSFEEIRERILTANTPHVDAISGATSQSEAVKKAVAKAMLKSSKALAAEEGVVAMGETGLDYFYTPETKTQQQTSFRDHIRIEIGRAHV